MYIDVGGLANQEPENEFEAMKREISELSNLHGNYDDEDDPDTELFKNGKKKKKKKHKKGRFVDDRLDMLLGDEDLDNDDDILLGDDIISKKKPKKGKVDIFDIKAAKKKRKKNIEAKFAPQLTLLRKLLKDAEMTTADANEIFQKMKASSRYVGKNLVDLLSAINSSNSTRASIIRDISNINKTIIDLQLKESKGKKDEDSKDKNMEEFGADFFSRMFGGGNKKSLKEQARDYYNSQDYDDDYDYEAEDSYISERLSSESGRSSDGDAYIKYEHLQPQDCILYHSDGSWETAAIDKTGALMDDDYPVIPKENLGEVRFNLEDHKATDISGRIFKIIEVD